MNINLSRLYPTINCVKGVSFINKVGKIYGFTFLEDNIELHVFNLNEYGVLLKCVFSYLGRVYFIERSSKGNHKFFIVLKGVNIEIENIKDRWL